MKRIICVVICVCMLLFTATVFAKQDSDIASIQNGDFPQGEVSAPSSHGLQGSPDEIGTTKLEPESLLNAGPSPMNLEANDIVTITNKMETANQNKIAVVTLQPNQILQARLEMLTIPNVSSSDPNAINTVYNYDLYLYEVDSDLNIGAMVDYSLLKPYFHNINGVMKTVDDGVCIINEKNTPQSYGIRIHAQTLADLSQDYNFRLSYTIDSAANAEFREGDQNPFHPCADMYPGQYADQVKMNSPIDDDWFALIVPSGYFGVRTLLSNSDYNFELYKFEEQSGGLKLVAPVNGSQYRLKPEYYYLRVFPNITDFVVGEYTMDSTIVNIMTIPDSIVITGYDSETGPDDYPSYIVPEEEGYIRGYRWKGPTLTVKGKLIDADGQPAMVDGIPIGALWESGGWGSNKGGKGMTDINGEFSIDITDMPVAKGVVVYRIPGAQIWTHYYDVDTVKVTSLPSEEGKDLIIRPTEDRYVFHFAYSIFNEMG